MPWGTSTQLQLQLLTLLRLPWRPAARHHSRRFHIPSHPSRRYPPQLGPDLGSLRTPQRGGQTGLLPFQPSSLRNSYSVLMPWGTSTQLQLQLLTLLRLPWRPAARHQDSFGTTPHDDEVCTAWR
ncbi:hypothetical protein VaNZ11_008805 [Volvox africanus]|uniref:Secreted protein n=1 Tax=Volvox africanus TaxID=51714 RepID=A0ABQ5S7F8_9CHLO|nr:hypothetical protein VaNZ11_008805 [Volvox africanus]